MEAVLRGLGNSICDIHFVRVHGDLRASSCGVSFLTWPLVIETVAHGDRIPVHLVARSWAFILDQHLNWSVIFTYMELRSESPQIILHLDMQHESFDFSLFYWCWTGTSHLGAFFLSLCIFKFWFFKISVQDSFLLAFSYIRNIDCYFLSPASPPLPCPSLLFTSFCPEQSYFHVQLTLFYCPYTKASFTNFMRLV